MTEGKRSNNHQEEHNSTTMTDSAVSSEERRHINQGLWLEQKQFMEMLQRKRAQRSELEATGAISIQSAFRGFSVRRQTHSLYAAASMRKKLREDLRDLLKDQNMILQGVQHKQKVKELRHSKAIVIQCAYRRVLSYRAYERKKLLHATDRRHRGASTIQRAILTWRSKQLTNKLRERHQWLRTYAACIR